MMMPYPARGLSVPLKPAVPSRTLVVEDDPDSCETLTLMLRRLGHEVECAESTGAALVKLEEWMPDFVLLDLMLPDAPGGLVLRKIRQMNLPIRVALVTAAGDHSIILKHARGYDPDAVFTKPLDHAAIRAWLKSN
jgi:CheY-like chemotaxis protein